MQHLDATLHILFAPNEQDLVRSRVLAREQLATESPAVRQWLADMRLRMSELIDSLPSFQLRNYGEARLAILVLLSREGIVQFTDPYSVRVPEQEGAPFRYVRQPPAACDERRMEQPERPQAPVAGTVVAAGAREPAMPEPEPEILDPAEHVLVDTQGTPPQTIETIHGSFIERERDGEWVVECDIPTGSVLDVAIVAEGGAESNFQMRLKSHGEQKVDLQLPAGVRPAMVVFVALDERGVIVARGVYGSVEPK